MAGRQKLLFNTFRSFHRSTVFRENKNSETISTTPKDAEKKGQTILPGSKTGSPLGPVMVEVSQFNKYLLVWNREYKSMSDVPSRIRYETISNVHSKSRIKIGTLLMVLTLIGCYMSAQTGKNQAAAGETIQSKILEDHRVRKEEYLTQLKKESKSS